MGKSIKKRADEATQEIRKHVKAIEGSIDRIRPAPRRSKVTMAAVAGAVAGAAGVVAAVRHVRKGSDRVVTLHVQPTDEGWGLMTDGSEKPKTRFETKREAVSAGREEAAKSAPSDLVIHRRDGSVERSHAYKAD
jgi:hypothetical protein